jgi:hypothetical protein
MIVGFFKIDPPKTALSQTTDYNRCDALLALQALAASRPKMVDWGKGARGEPFGIGIHCFEAVKEASMRIIALSVAASLALVSSVAFAQQTPASPPAIDAPPPAMMPPTAGAAPVVGGPLISHSDTGLNKVAEDGVSTKTVRAVPCSIAARETDGTTTCIGIPGPVGSLKAKSGNTAR